MLVGRKLFVYVRGDQVKVAGPQYLNEFMYESPVLTVLIWKSNKEREPTSGLEPLTYPPVTSLLAQVLARPGASGNRAYLASFRHF